MEIIFISNQIKYDILKILDLPAAQSYNLHGTTVLDSIGYGKDEELYRKLENKLQEIANEYQTGRLISRGDLSNETTVRQCIQLVLL
ncbi:hypothetical protein [Mucilaginibacter sp.]|uniref:hypothetical protein n=1 Tax=Mucilaginibacter sp. TaxID=1882438 RepID=UPI0035BC4C63